MEYFNAFLCGGLLCALGQILIDRTKLTPAKILVCYVTAGVILGGSGLYQYLVDWAGAGATVPLTGFGYTLAKGRGRRYSSTACWGLLSGEPPPRQAVWRPPSSSAFWPPCCSKPGPNTKKIGGVVQNSTDFSYLCVYQLLPGHGHLFRRQVPVRSQLDDPVFPA